MLLPSELGNNKEMTLIMEKDEILVAVIYSALFIMLLPV